MTLEFIIKKEPSDGGKVCSNPQKRKRGKGMQIEDKRTLPSLKIKRREGSSRCTYENFYFGVISVEHSHLVLSFSIGKKQS